MKHQKHLVFLMAFAFVTPVFADGETEAGLTLLEAPAARPAALGEAYSASQNDIAGLNYNPSSLGTLKRNQAVFLFQRGINEDSSGHLAIGHPLGNGGMGVSVGYYDGGEFILSDGRTSRLVTAQRDLTVNFGYAANVKKLSIGVGGKYLSSELAETDTASAVAGDVGAGYQINNRVRIGGALQNFGTKLKFQSTGDDLPRIARVGLMISVAPYNLPTNFFLDAPYHLNPEEFQPAVGAETYVGPLAFRAGYKTGSDLEELTLGTGFLIGQIGIDYSFGLVDDLDSRHRISVGLEFGPTPGQPDLVQQEKPKRTIVEIDPENRPLIPPEEEKFDLGESETIDFPVSPE